MGRTQRNLRLVPDGFIQQLGTEFNSVKTKYVPFTVEQYKALEENMALYKQDKNNHEAKEYILFSFNNYLRKYCLFIKRGYITFLDHTNQEGVKGSRIDPAIWRFVCLYCSNKTKSKMEQFSDTAKMIRELFYKLDYEDIYNSLVIALFKMANKYKILTPEDPYYKENGSFHMYVDKAFHWAAYRELSQFIGDPSVNYGNVQYDELADTDPLKLNDLIDTKFERNEFEAAIEQTTRNNLLASSKKIMLKEKAELDPYESDSLNFNWINGITCDDIFKALTPYERELLVLIFVKHMDFEQIARTFGYNKVTISIQKRNIVKKLQKSTGWEYPVTKGENTL